MKGEVNYSVRELAQRPLAMEILLEGSPLFFLFTGLGPYDTEFPVPRPHYRLAFTSFKNLPLRIFNWLYN